MWWIPLIASAVGGTMSQIGANQLAADRQAAGKAAMRAQLAEQQKFRDQALGQTVEMAETYGDIPVSEQDVSEQLFAKSRPTNIGEETAQSRLANLKATKASRASADVKGKGISQQRQAADLQGMAAPLSITLDDAKRMWAMTPARMQSEMNRVNTPFLMTLGNLLNVGGQLGSLGMGLFGGGAGSPTTAAAPTGSPFGSSSNIGVAPPAARSSYGWAFAPK